MKCKNLLKSFKVSAIATVLVLCSTLSASAQSTVYIFTSFQWWEATPIFINGEEAFELDSRMEKIGAFYIHAKSTKKCTFHSEGKVLISFDYSMPHPSIADGPTLHFADEIILNLYDGSIHYVALSPQGLSSMQLIEIDEKKAQKYLSNKKFDYLPEYIEPKEEE